MGWKIFEDLENIGRLIKRYMEQIGTINLTIVLRMQDGGRWGGTAKHSIL